MLNVKFPKPASNINITNLVFTLTNPDQIAKVSLVSSKWNTIDITSASSFFGTPIDNPTATVSFTGNVAQTTSDEWGFNLLVDLKPDAAIGTIIDAVCTSVTTSQGTFSPAPVTDDRNAVVAANLTGTKTVSSTGDYTSLSAVIAALNAYGVGEGGVTFEVADDQTFTNPPYGASTIINQTGTAARPIVIKRSGTGTNKPIFSFPAGGGSYDSFIGGTGVSYLTIDGLDLRATNTSPTAKFELPINFLARLPRVARITK
jgi:hypothetical protein